MKNSIKTFVLVFIFSISSITTFAANPTDDEDLATFNDPAAMPGDPGATPINDYLVPMLVFGIVLGCFLLKKKNRKIV